MKTFEKWWEVFFESFQYGEEETNQAKSFAKSGWFAYGLKNFERDEKVREILRKLVVAKDGDAMLLRPHMRRLADEALVLMDGYDEKGDGR